MDRTWWNMSSLGYNRERNMHYWAGVGMARTWWNMSSLGYNRERNMHYWAGERAWIEHGGT